MRPSPRRPEQRVGLGSSKHNLMPNKEPVNIVQNSGRIQRLVTTRITKVISDNPGPQLYQEVTEMYDQDELKAALRAPNLFNRTFSAEDKWNYLQHYIGENPSFEPLLPQQHEALMFYIL